MPLFPNYSACTWCTTSLSAVPLVGDTYSCSIVSGATTPISASTVYQYRAYVVISGTPYYGNIITGATLAMPTFAPTVCTGIMYSAAVNGGAICCNKMCNDCSAPIAEYGILYTQQPSYSSDACLRYDKVPTWVCKQSTFATIPDGTTYSGLMTGMTQNTSTYFRAFAKNSVGVGYGDVCNFVTSSPPSISMLYIYGCENNGVEDACNAGELQKPSAGKYYTATIAWCMYKGIVTAGPTPFCVSVCCNGIEIRDVSCICKGASSTWLTSSGSFASFPVDDNDTVVVNVCACTEGVTCGACTRAWLTSVSPNNGSYIVNYSQNSTVAYTCGTFPVLPILIE